MIGRILALAAALLAGGVLGAVGGAHYFAPKPADPTMIPPAIWAQLDRYAEANAALTEPAPDEVRIVFLGDSNTRLWADEPLFDDDALIGRGIDGQRSEHVLLRFRTDVVALKPRVVHVMIGTNDIAADPEGAPDSVLENVRALHVMAKAHHIEMVLASVPPARGFHWAPQIEPRAAIAALNAKLKAYADAEGLVYADYHAALADDSGGIAPSLAPDGAHLSAEGYALMAPVTAEALSKARERVARRADLR